MNVKVAQVGLYKKPLLGPKIKEREARMGMGLC
jgi:hypothetical protein